MIRLPNFDGPLVLADDGFQSFSECHWVRYSPSSWVTTTGRVPAFVQRGPTNAEGFGQGL